MQKLSFKASDLLNLLNEVFTELHAFSKHTHLQVQQAVAVVLTLGRHFHIFRQQISQSVQFPPQKIRINFILVNGLNHLLQAPFKQLNRRQILTQVLSEALLAPCKLGHLVH